MFKNQNMVGVLLALFAFTSYSIADAALKYAGQSLAFYQIAFFTQAFGLIFVALYALVSGRSLKTYHPKLQLYRGIAFTLCYYLIIYAFQHKSLAEVYTLFYINPFLVAIFSVIILKEKIGKHRLASIAIGFIGVLIILRPGVLAFDVISLGVLIASTAFAYANVLTRKIGESEPILSFTFYTTGFIFLVSASFFVFNPALPQNTTTLFSLSLAGGAETFGTAILAIAFIKTNAVTISKLMYSSIIWAFLFGYLLFGDVLVDGWTIFGGGIIILSGLYMVYREKLASER